MNIGFAARPGFSAYVLLLMISGIAMIGLASPAVRYARMPSRILNAIVGVGFFGYGFYLAFVFSGGTYVLFFKAFILPAVLILQTVRSARVGRKGAPATAPAATGIPLPAAAPVPPAVDGTFPRL